MIFDHRGTRYVSFGNGTVTSCMCHAIYSVAMMFKDTSEEKFECDYDIMKNSPIALAFLNEESIDKTISNLQELKEYGKRTVWKDEN